MRCFLSIFLVVVALSVSLAVSPAIGNDELFSEVAMESVFEASVSLKATTIKEQTDLESARSRRLKATAELFQASEPEPSVDAEESFSIIGRWSATLSGGQVFAIGLTDAKKFSLVHLAKGTPTISSGTFLLADGKLTLSANGAAPLESQISWATPDQFFMQIGSARIAFKRKK